MDTEKKTVESLTAVLGERPNSISTMAGATSSDLFLIGLTDRKLVLRIFREERWESSASSLTEREATILAALTQSPIPAPAPQGTIPENGVLMSWLPGSVNLPERPDAAWLTELAATLSQIHRSGVSVPFDYQSWNDVRGKTAPGWWQDAGLWGAVQLAAEEEPRYDPVFIHRDYHPVNVLWEDGRISGVVDWINACLGPAGVDVAHCRLNLALMYGVSAADEFLRAFERCCPDYKHHSYWDIDDALGALPNVEPYAPWAEFGLSGITTVQVRERLQTYLRSVISTHPGK